MIARTHSNSKDVTARTLAAPKPVVYIAQTPRGLWHWHRQTPAGSIYSSRERYPSEAEALRAAASIATCKSARLKVSPRQQAYIICHWLAVGEDLFHAGRTFDELPANRHIRQGWHEAAAWEAVRQETDSKPGLDADVDPAPTLEEALDLQDRALSEQIAANNALLAGEVR